jgi:hypothetical protein
MASTAIHHRDHHPSSLDARRMDAIHTDQAASSMASTHDRRPRGGFVISREIGGMLVVFEVERRPTSWVMPRNLARYRSSGTGRPGLRRADPRSPLNRRSSTATSASSSTCGRLGLLRGPENDANHSTSRATCRCRSTNRGFGLTAISKAQASIRRQEPYVELPAFGARCSPSSRWPWNRQFR